MARRVRLKADPTLARDHADGSTVRLVQPCVHERLGPLWLGQVQHLGVHLALARELRAKLEELDGHVAATPLIEGSRQITDANLVTRLYIAGSLLAIHTVLALQHLVLWLEALAGRQVDGDSTTRLATLLGQLGYQRDLSLDPRWSRLCEVEGIRHAIEHPTKSNTYVVDTKDWDRVPLTWIASGRAMVAFDQASELLDELTSFAEAGEKARPGPNAFHIDARGIRALNDAKKPPRPGPPT